MTFEIIKYGFALYVLLLVYFIFRYTPRLRAWLAPFKKQKRLTNNKKNRLALIIPARNESSVIESLFLSLENQTYDKDYFEAFVVVKDLNDETINLAKKYGAHVYVLENQTCKGDCLDYCLKEMNKEGLFFDGYMVIDADCMLEKNCLLEMNNAMASNAMVIQAKKIVKNYLSDNKKANNWVSESNGLIWTIIDELGNRYKTEEGITNMTIGTGIMFTRRVIDALGGWPYRETLTEDIEFMNDCALRGFTTYYYSYSQIYVEESTSLKVTNKRRSRWLTGVIDSKRLYIKDLNEKMKTHAQKRDKYFVTGLSKVFWYIGLSTIYAVLCLFGSFVLFLFRSPYFLDLLICAGISVLVIYVSFLILTAFCIAADYKYILIPWYKKLGLLFIHPIFYMGYIPIIAKALAFKNNRGWEVIDREATITIDIGKEERSYGTSETRSH